MKNVVFWVGIKSDNPSVMEKHGNFEYFEYSKKTWQYWCKKNDVIFYEYNSTEYDTEQHKVTWTRWFDLESQLSDIEWGKVAVVDASYMIKWDSPNFFELTGDTLSTFRSLENLRWITEGIRGYQPLFASTKFDMKRYIDCGFQVFTKSHLPFLRKLMEVYLDNVQKFRIFEQTIKKGTDQPVYNYMLQSENIDFKFELNPSFNINHMSRFGWLGHNWQLQEDKTPYFIKYGNIWKFSGFDRKQRTPLMRQTWELISHNYK